MFGQWRDPHAFDYLHTDTPHIIRIMPCGTICKARSITLSSQNEFTDEMMLERQTP